jgi:hypothetical protein
MCLFSLELILPMFTNLLVPWHGLTTCNCLTPSHATDTVCVPQCCTEFTAGKRSSYDSEQKLHKSLLDLFIFFKTKYEEGYTSFNNYTFIPLSCNIKLLYKQNSIFLFTKYKLLICYPSEIGRFSYKANIKREVVYFSHLAVTHVPGLRRW